MLRGLLITRRFGPLFWSQFFGALNDNLVKNAIAIMIVFGMASVPGNSGLIVTLASVMLILPFFLFSGIAGELADYNDKARVARWVKAAEVVAATVALAGFIIESIPILMTALFLTGTLSALFGPVKYGILPDYLKKDELVAGNALIEAGTFIAILSGTVLGGVLADLSPWIAGAVAVLVSLVALAATFRMPAAPAVLSGRPDWNFARSTFQLLRELREDRNSLGCSISISWFWAVGAIMVSLIPVIVADYGGGSTSVATLFLAVFTVGIGFGSMTSSLISGGRIVKSLVPIGTFLIGAFAIDLSFALRLDGEAAAAAASGGWLAYISTSEGCRVLVNLIGLSASGGFLAVPAFAALQAGAPEDRRARTVASNNILNAAFMVAASILLMLAQKMDVATSTIIAIVGLANFAAVPVLSRCMNALLFQDTVYLLMRAMFRVKVEGFDNLSDGGKPRVIAVNHVSLLDAALVMSILGRDTIFAIDTNIAKQWWVKPFLKNVRTFPVDPTKPMSMKTMTSLVASGETLVIFPEGRITVTAANMKVYDGTAMVALKTNADVVPMWIDGLDRSPMSYLDKTQVPKRAFPKVHLRILPPQKIVVGVNAVGRNRRRAAGRALQDIMTDARMKSFLTDATLPQAIKASSEKFGGGHIAIEDALGGKLSYRKLLTAAAVLDGALGSSVEPKSNVGVLLPNSVGVVVTMLAVMRRGSTPAMLNFTAGPGNLVAACQTAKMSTVLTSRSFIEKAKLETSAEALEKVANVIYLEDVRNMITTIGKLKAIVFRNWYPKTSADDAGVVLFTSGSEGSPKGVVLSHRNILTNCAQVTSRFDFSMEDSIFNALPVFHSFGLMGGLVLPLVSGIKTFLYPSPIHYRIIPEMVYQKRSTAIFGTDAFLAGYAKAAHPYDFSSVRYVVAGAEKVKSETRAVWNEKFGLRILEGYGITEGAPVIAVNTPFDFRIGTVGRFVPGLEHRLEEVPGVDEGGRLFVRGPNVMKGYLLASEPGVLRPPAEGWHDTGDIVAIDEDGFITIKGRVKRFSKIAGEMVSLAAVDSYVASAYPEAAHVAVAVPDAKKGERIVLLTTRKEMTKSDLLAAARAKGANELMVPAAILHVNELPLLGSGKTDFVAATKLAIEASAS